MPYCKNCGAEIAETDAYCSNCGAKNTPSGRASGAQPVSSVLPSDDDIRENKTIAALAYVGPLCLIAYFGKKDSPFAQYHGLRGLNFCILCAIAALFGAVLRNIFLIGWLFSIALTVGWIYLMITGIVNATNGVCKDLPYIGQIRFVQK